MAKYEVDPVAEITEALGVQAARRINRALSGAAKLSPGRAARLAEGLSVAAERLKDRARDEVVLDQGRAIDCGVAFSYRRGYDRENLDAKAVKLLLPRDKNPDLYSDTPIAETINISVGPPPQG